MRVVRSEFSELAGILGLAALALAVLPGAAQAALTARVAEWGELYAEVTGFLIGPEHEQHALTPALATRAPEFTRRTDRIEARLCGQFGVAIALQADPPDSMPRSVQVRVRHPRLTRPDGASSTEDSFQTFIAPRTLPDAPAGAERGWTSSSFMFNYAWEMQPGAWTFEFRDGDAVLSSKTFTVTVPPGGAGRPECGPAAVS